MLRDLKFVKPHRKYFGILKNRLTYCFNDAHLFTISEQSARESDWKIRFIFFPPPTISYIILGEIATQYGKYIIAFDNTLGSFRRRCRRQGDIFFRRKICTSLFHRVKIFQRTFQHPDDEIDATINISAVYNFFSKRCAFVQKNSSNAAATGKRFYNTSSFSLSGWAVI